MGTSPAPPSCTASDSKRFQQQQKHKQQQQQQQQLKQQQQFEANQPLRDDHKLCNNPLSHCSNFVVSCLWLSFSATVITSSFFQPKFRVFDILPFLEHLLLR